MKRVILSALLFAGVSGFASAQTATGNSSTTTGAVSSTSKNPKGKKAKPSERLDNRRTYHFKNGQRSTPTGNEATGSGIGGGFAALGKNNASDAKGDTVATRQAATPAKPKTTRKKTGSKQ